MDAAVLIPLVVVSGFFDGIHPCGIAVLLFFVGFLIYSRKSRKEMLMAGGAYILGVFFAYLGIGLGIAGVFSLFPGHFMAKVGAGLLVLAGAAGIFEGIAKRSLLKIPSQFSPAISGMLQKSTLPAAFAGGVLVGLCAFPCAGGIYVAIIGLISANMVGAEGLAYLVIYNVMFVMPLILILALASNRKALEWIGKTEKKSRWRFKLWLGIMMAALGAYILLTL